MKHYSTLTSQVYILGETTTIWPHATVLEWGLKNRIYTRQMLAALWGEPEVHRHVVVKKHNACRLAVSVQHAVNRI